MVTSRTNAFSPLAVMASNMRSSSSQSAFSIVVEMAAEVLVRLAAARPEETTCLAPGERLGGLRDGI